MESVNKAIGLACENGYCWTVGVTLNSMLLDPKWWQSLGKAMGWEEFAPYSVLVKEKKILSAEDFYPTIMETWKLYALRFYEINLTEGGDTEAFFTTLLNGENK